MRATLLALWERRSPRERRVIAVAAAVLAAALYGVLVLAAGRAREPLRDNVVALRGQALQLDGQAIDVVRLRAAPAAATSATPLRSLVQDSLDANGLARAVARLDATDAEHVVVVFGEVAFAEWLDWIVALRAQQVRLESCRIDLLAAPGRVGVTATLVRPGPR